MSLNKHSLKVGVDARLLSRPITGIGRYTLELCRALCKMRDVQLYLYSPSPVSLEIVSSLSPSTIRSSSYSSKIYTQWWSEFVLPFWAKQDGVDVFWGPAHRLPRWLPQNIASIVTIHDVVWKYAPYTMHPLTRMLERIQMPTAIKNAHHIVTDSQSTATAILKEFKVKNDKIAIIKLGADHLKSNSDKNVLKPLNIHKPYFLFVGTLEPRKNLLNLLMAYSGLPEQMRSNLMLVIAGGSGWGGINLEEKIQALGLQENVKRVGYVDDLVLASLYANARFLAMPSVYEGFGLPLVEALSYGIPVLTSNNSSMREIVGSAGLLVDPNDIQSIRDGLFRLIGDEKVYRRLANHAANHAKQFKWDLSANQLVTVFKKVNLNARHSRL